ncbi:MAG: GAF domain-containing protein, partial [Chloroflexi bacterium]|nr:GAF domain-containing protein [Chloroflexota bacterium]
EDDGNLFVRAESHIGEKPAVESLNLKLDDTEDISKVIVRYVQRTGEKVILNDAGKEGIFKDNPEVQRMQLRSVLCLPVVKKSGMFGILYLENRLAGSVFTPEKIQTMELLASQAAISLENARLVEDMKKAEEQVETSLKQKETLLKEIHHRVKNNLQIIYSMLNLQLPQVKDSEAVALFKESQNRVFTMALIHEKLYQSESMARIDLPEYVRGLISNLFLTYGVSGVTVRPKINVENISLDVDLAIPCALIINELVSNSLKHAFLPAKWSGKAGEIRIDLHRTAGNTLTLAVSDNGIGMPPGFKIEDSPSLGLKLVRVLAKQLNGSIRIGTVSGTEIAITFPLPDKETG